MGLSFPALSLRKSARPRVGRVIACFGPPKAGVSLATTILSEECRANTAIVPGFDEDAVRKLRQKGAEVVFLDGFPNSVEDVQTLFDSRCVYTGEGAVVRFIASPRSIAKRLKLRDTALATFLADYEAHMTRISAMEDRIRRLNIPYHCVQNEELDVAVGELARRSQIRN